MTQKTLRGATAVISIGFSLMASTHVHAAVTAEEAKQLGTTLTPIGAEIAGNKDGSIPAWDVTKTIKTVPGSERRDLPSNTSTFPDRFPGDARLFSITAENVDKYADKLDPGNQYLLKHRPGYRIDVYPTRRTIYHPNWVFENNKHCAVTAKLTAGNGLEGAHACTPFPIPKNGYEAMWNMQTFIREPNYSQEGYAYLVDGRGVITKIGRTFVDNNYPYWDSTAKDSPYLYRSVSEYLAPAAKAGGRDLQIVPLRIDLEEQRTYSYTPGLRRVRLAPELTYDTVITAFGGIYLADELNSFQGRMDRFDFKLLGKKEMYVQYNNDKQTDMPIEELLDKQYPRPETTRWELHRVWIIEGTLKPGMRHSQSKKVFYVDEDSWTPLVYNAYDQEGKLVKAFYNGIFSDGVTNQIRFSLNTIYDLSRGYYAIPLVYDKGAAYLTVHGPLPPATYSADSFAGRGIR